MFPVHIRVLAYGLCYNFGRFIAAGAVFIVAAVRKQNDGKDLTRVTSWIAVVPLAGFIFLMLGFGYETFDGESAPGLERKEDSAEPNISAATHGVAAGTDSPQLSVQKKEAAGSFSQPLLKS